MTDDLEARVHHAITHNGETYIKLADASVTFGLYRKDIAAKDAEIARLRDDLATARREGMEDAAKIAEGEAYEGLYRTWPWWKNKDGSQGNKSNESYLVKHCDKIAAAIRAAEKEGKP